MSEYLCELHSNQHFVGIERPTLRLNFHISDKTGNASYVMATAGKPSDTTTLYLDAPIDVTDLSYIKAHAECQAYAGMNISKTDKYYYNSNVYKWATANGKAITNQIYGTRFNILTPVDFVLDVRDITGLWYVRLGCNYNYLEGQILMEYNAITFE